MISSLLNNIFKTNKAQKKSEVGLSWNITDDLLDNIKLPNEYNKIFSIKHLMLKNGYSELEIENYMKYKNPYTQLLNDFKKYNIKDVDVYCRVPLITEKNLNIIKLILIEEPKDNYLDDLIVDIINTIVIGFDLDIKYNKIGSLSSYDYLIRSLSNNTLICDEDICICLNAIIKRKGSISSFLDTYYYLQRNGYFCSEYKNLEKIIGSQHINGIIFKIIELSLKKEKVNYKKIFYNKDISSFDDYTINDVVFSKHSNNKLLFNKSFEKFRDDLNLINKLIIDSNNKYRSEYFDIVIPQNLIDDKNNYSIEFKQLTDGGRKKKYPLTISFSCEINGIHISSELLYNSEELNRINITMQMNWKIRNIIAKKYDKIELYEVSEKDYNVDLTTKLLYNRD